MILSADHATVDINNEYKQRTYRSDHMADNAALNNSILKKKGQGDKE